eukprot:GHVO01065122.1.p1 GENE.GHVO01065122.1~~GHVO01065122.1.p1  ORF type:complete len:125 (-),score=40.81 GHVO01065122.1:128-502(-)
MSQMDEKCKEVSCRDKLEGEFDASPFTSPPDRRELGRATWMFMHGLTANMKGETGGGSLVKWAGAFASLYPCPTCRPGFERAVGSDNVNKILHTTGRYPLWMCAIHNEINKELGGKEMTCDDQM